MEEFKWFTIKRHTVTHEIVTTDGIPDDVGKRHGETT